MSYVAWYKMRLEALGMTEAMTKSRTPSQEPLHQERGRP